MDEAYIETQTGNRIKVVRSDRGGEFHAQQLINHQNQKGTIREFTVHDSPPQNGVAERGMRTRAERARALLIASGLPRFLWEEAMKHATWLQNRLPAAALDGKTPYEAIHGKKPHLAGIQEFGAAAYVKDLKAGKLDARAHMGRFVGYDSESKGFRIYWAGKRSVTIERNVVFNENDVRNDGSTVSIGPLSEGEKEAEKVIQGPEDSSENPEQVEDEQYKANKPEQESVGEDQGLKTQSSIPFPSDETETQVTTDDEQTSQGRARRVEPKPQGMYKKMHLGPTRGMVAGIAVHDDQSLAELEHIPEDIYDSDYNLPPDVAALGHTWSDPQTLDEVLRGPNAKEWQAALDYEINQLQKFGTWVVEDLPKGQMAIPCSEVLRVKRGPSGEVQSY